LALEEHPDLTIEEQVLLNELIGQYTFAKEETPEISSDLIGTTTHNEFMPSDLAESTSQKDVGKHINTKRKDRNKNKILPV
jgi:hypothetical protein